MQHHLVMIFAHPDDESFGFAGTASALVDAGHRVSYICATRGEVGEIRIEGLATRDTLGEVRERELRSALNIIGVSDLRLLGYRDSGMEGTAENQDPRAFVNQNVGMVAGAVADLLVEMQPTIVLTYGIDGIYGHPDHVHIHHVASEAIPLAAERGWETPNLYFSAASRERIRRMALQPGSPFSNMAPEKLAVFGTPSAEITTWLDIRAYSDRKLRALNAHRTQVGTEGPFATSSQEERELWLSLETVRMIPQPWNVHPVDVLLELLPEAPADHPFRS